MKIVHVIFSLQYGGAETLLVDIVNEQAKKEDVSLFIINDDCSLELLQGVRKNVDVELLGRNKGKLDFVSWCKSMAYFYQVKPDIVHCHDSKSIYFIPFWKYKTVLTVHAVNLSLRGIRRYSSVVSISNAVNEDVFVRKQIKSQTIYNGICMKGICKKDIQPINQRKVKLLQVSRLDHRVKGQHILIKALAILKNQYKWSNFTLDFIGDGDSMDYLIELVEKNNLSHYVRFLGEKDRTSIYKHICDYDLLIQPSLTEGFGLTIIESMAAKVPVLVSDIDGPIEIIEKGKYGYSFKKGDERDLAGKIMEIINHYDLVIPKVEEAYSYCVDTFGIGTTVQRYFNLYKSLLGEHS